MTKTELLTFICDMFNVPQCPEMILRQIHKYVTERRYDYLEIARALSFYVDVKGQTLDIKYGIGIVPFVMEDARTYYRQKEEQKKAQIAAAQAAQQQQEKEGIKVQVKKKKTIKKPHIDISQL